MKKYIRIASLLIFAQLLFAHFTFAQLDSIFDQGVYRTFIVHTPAGYNASNQYPVVVNLHGDNSNAASQESYSQFDPVADSNNFIVVYPNSVNGIWTINGTSDVNFLSHLIDTIRANYSCNACLFSTGISGGGFMTYKLACALPQHLTAIAVVSGNMSQNLENNCVIANGLPVMHFHGSADPLVNYNGTIGIPPVDTTILWWVKQDNCNTTPLFTALPNTDLADSCTVQNYYYSGGINGSLVSFYKIINGGHTWPGAIPVPPLGNTNEDINASDLIGSFFQQFCSASVGIKDIPKTNTLSVFPNPAQNIFTVELGVKNFQLEVSDLFGKQMLLVKEGEHRIRIDCSDFSNGIYFIHITNRETSYNRKVIISR